MSETQTQNIEIRGNLLPRNTPPEGEAGIGASEKKYQESLVKLKSLIADNKYLEPEEKSTLGKEVDAFLASAIDSFDNQIGQLSYDQQVAALQKRQELYREGVSLVDSFTAMMQGALAGSADFGVITNGEFAEEVQGPLIRLKNFVARQWSQEERPRRGAQVLKVYRALEAAVPEVKERLDWTEALVSRLQGFNESYLALVMTLIQDESGFKTRPWRDELREWGSKIRVMENPKTYGPFQIHLAVARDIAKERNEYTSDEDLIRMLENDKKRSIDYFMQIIGRITRLYATNNQITEDNFNFIRADYLSGIYSSKNAAVQKQLVVLGYMPKTYTEGKIWTFDQSGIDGDIGDKCLSALVDFARDHHIMDEQGQPYSEEILIKNYFGRFSNRTAFSKTPLYQGLKQAYFEKTGQKPPDRYLTERRTKGGFYSTAESVKRSAAIFKYYGKKLS